MLSWDLDMGSWRIMNKITKIINKKYYTLLSLHKYINTCNWEPQNDIIFRECNIQVIPCLAQIRFSSSLAFVSLNPIFILLDRNTEVTSFCSSKFTCNKKRRISQNIWNTPQDLKANPVGSTEERYIIYHFMDPIGTLAGGWTNPFEKYACQIGANFPKVRGEKKQRFQTTTYRWLRTVTGLSTNTNETVASKAWRSKTAKLQVVLFCCFPFLQ